MAELNVCIVGGTGFVGRSIATRLVGLGHRVLIISRDPDRHRDLWVLPTARLVAGDVHNPAVLRRYFPGMDAVVNLVGILNERGRTGKGFEHAHVALPEKIVAACRDSGVPRLLHMSALHADPGAPSFYLRTKARGEELVHRAEDETLHVTSFRPSVIFGPRDSFTNRFAGLLRLAPGVFLLACPDARFQPVYVEDVAHAFVAAIADHHSYGRRYDLCGPRVYTLRELVAYVARLLGLRRRIIGLNDTLSRLQATLLEFAPGKPFSLDNYRSLQVDAVCAEGKAFPAPFRIAPTPLEQVAPGYLGTGLRHRYAGVRQQAGR